MSNQFEDGQQAYEDGLLMRYCQRVPLDDLVSLDGEVPVDDRWRFEAGDLPRSREATLGLIRAHLGLGLEPTGIFSAAAFVALYDRLVALEKDLQHSQLKH